MTNVIDFGKKQEQVMFNKLSSKLQANRREVEANPWPLINRQQDEIIKYHRLIEDISKVLNPMPILLETSNPIQPIDHGVEALLMIDEIKELIKGL